MGEERVLWDFPSSPILFYGLAQAPENFRLFGHERRSFELD
jgi:hypothetical protein